MSDSSETSASVRRQSVLDIVREGSDASGLLHHLRDTDWRVREEAIRGIRGFRSKEALIAPLVEALSDTTDIAYRNAAAAALAIMGSRGVPAMHGAVAFMDADARKLVVEACARIPTGTAVSLLLGLSNDEDVNVRVAVCEALAFARSAGVAEAKRAAEVLEACAREDSIPLRIAALSALAELGEPIGAEQLRALSKDELSLPHAVRAAAGSHDPDVLSILAELACRSGDVSDAALCALAATLPVSRGSVFFAVSRGGDALRRALESAAVRTEASVRGAALDLLPAVFRPEHLSLYLNELADGAASESAARGLAALAPMIGGHLLTSAEYSHVEAWPVAARILAPLLDEGSALDVSRRWLLAPPPVLEAGWVDVLVLLPVLADDVSWERVYEATEGPSARSAMELLARRAALAPRYARDELARLGGRGGERSCAALLLGIARSEPLAPEEARLLQIGAGAADPLVRELSLVAAAHGATVDVHTIVGALADEAPHVVVAAIEAAARNGCVDEIDDLARRTTDAQILVASVSALSSIASKRAGEVVLRRIHEGDDRLAAAALSRVPATHPAVVMLCEQALLRASSDAQLPLAALNLLAASADARALPTLLRLLDHPRFEVRASAAGLLSSQRGREALVRRLEREEDATVTDAIRKSLRRP